MGAVDHAIVYSSYRSGHSQIVLANIAMPDDDCCVLWLHAVHICRLSGWSEPCMVRSLCPPNRVVHPLIIPSCESRTW